MKMKQKKLVRGVGINDAGYATQKFETVSYANGKRKRKKVWVCPYYRAWENMLSRCYSAKYQERQPAYIGCTVSEEWLTFSNFKAWMEKQEWEGKQLSKDLLFEGNKVYSAENCVFVTRAVNNLTTDSKASRGEWFNVGATLNQNTGEKTMNNLILSGNSQITMSSREIAELTGKRHDSVKRTMDSLQSKGLITITQTVEPTLGGGKPVTIYNVGKRDSYVVVAQLSPEFTARLVDRWEALESGKAQPIAAPVPVTPMQKAVSDMHEWKSAAALFSIPEAVAMVEGVKHVEHMYAVDFRPLLLSSPMMDDIKDDEVMLEPTEIGKRIGYSGKEVNLALLKAGLQTKVDGQWQPTEKAQGYTSRHFWMSKQSGKSGYNYKWNLEFVRRQLGK